MNSFLRGVLYGFSLVILSGITSGVCSYNENIAPVAGFVVFLLAGLFFLKREKISEILTCGFSGLFSMFLFQIVFAVFIIPDILVYIGGFFGTMVALAISLLTIGRQFAIWRFDTVNEHEIFDRGLKVKMLVYAIVTAISFAYLALGEDAGIGVLVFGILQTGMLFFIVPGKKCLLWMMPILVMCANFFLSANTIWHLPNAVIGIAIYGLMFTKLDIKNVTLSFLGEMCERLFSAIGEMGKPFEWFFEVTEGKKGYVKRIAIALAISLVSVGVLCAVLSSADMVFSHSVGDMIESISDILNMKSLWKIAIGIVIGLYLFGCVYNSYFSYGKENKEIKIKGDVFITSFVMISILAVYTVFVVIQFKYLFSGSELPYGLNVTEYARRGFFELLGLTGVNVAVILIVTKITEHTKGKTLGFIKGLNVYLCAVTVVLLVSSFYRMQMYNETDGLTRLRFMVFGFLAFELAGLIITFVYIIKPKFNVVMVYGAIALCYYLVLNIVPMDKIIAKNQVDRYLSGERNEIGYVLTLSSDAASEVERAYKNARDYETELNAKYWLKNNCKECNDWRGFNLSEKKLCEIYGGIK